MIAVVDPKTRDNRLQRHLFPNPDKDVWLSVRQMQLQIEQEREGIEWHNALQACDLEYILQVSATGKAAAILSLTQKIHSSLYATEIKKLIRDASGHSSQNRKAKKQSQDEIIASTAF